MTLRRKRSPHILRSRRGPILTAAVVLLAALAIADRLGLLGWRGDDRSRYHDQTFRVVKVVDGDTLDVDAPDGSHATTRIRLWGVDTPEIAHGGQAEMYFGPEAKAFAQSLVLEKPVRLELSNGRTRDRYGRLLAFVYSADSGNMLNERLIETGHAYADNRFDHEFKKRFGELEARARKNKVGLWAQVTMNDMPLWRQRIETRRTSHAD